jgi:uncharacterized protein involved in type VI secretion and phage assembly
VAGDGGLLPATNWGDVGAAKMAGAAGARLEDLSTARELDTAELRRVGKARLARSVLSAITGRCTYPGSGLVGPGDVLEIKGLGTRFGGRAFVSGITHEIGEGGWRTTAMLGLDAAFAGDGRGLSGAAGQGIATPIHGLQTGIVEALTEDPEGRMRVKVLLPMISAEGAAVWARYAQPYASIGAGIQFMPEIGDEVLVAFLGADPGSPVVIGAVHSDGRAQAAAPDDANSVKGIVTREKLKMAFDDERKVIMLETPGGHVVTLDDEAGALTLTCSNGNTIEMGAGGIEITSIADLKIKATGALTANADGQVGIKAGMDAKLAGLNVACSGDVGFEGKGGATAKLSGGGQTTVEGAIVMIN